MNNPLDSFTIERLEHLEKLDMGATFDSLSVSEYNALIETALPAKQVPDGWIKCSERMPAEGGRYWCYVEEQNSLGKSHYQWNCSWNDNEWSDDALTGTVTHWMPLPAAPKPE